jgi:hypothetical protein
MPTGWTAEGAEYETRQEQYFFPLHVFQTGFGGYPASYPMGTESFAPQAMLREPEANHSLQLAPWSRICGSISPFPHTSLWRTAQLVKNLNKFAFI